jgi:hypothetical protein
MNERAPRTIAGVATMVFSLLLFAGFALHPHVLSPHLTTTADDLAAKFRHNPTFHVGHMLVFSAAPFIIASLSSITTKLVTSGRAFGLVGGTSAIIGAVILAGDKGSLCIVLSAFDTLWRRGLRISPPGPAGYRRTTRAAGDLLSTAPSSTLRHPPDGGYDEGRHGLTDERRRCDWRAGSSKQSRH